LPKVKHPFDSALSVPDLVREVKEAVGRATAGAETGGVSPTSLSGVGTLPPTGASPLPLLVGGLLLLLAGAAVRVTSRRRRLDERSVGLHAGRTS
jgi:hypothetical protein